MIVIGSGGHAKVCVDLLKTINRKVIGIVSLDKEVKSVLGVPVMGDEAIINDYSINEIELINGVGFLPGKNARRLVFEKFKKWGYTFATISHTSAIISPYSELLEGCQIMAGAVIQAGTKIGENCIINTSVSIDHDCVILDNCHMAPSVTLCGDVSIGPNTFVGVGSVVSNGLSIGKNVTVAAGKTIIKSIPDNAVLIKERQDVTRYAE